MDRKKILLELRNEGKLKGKMPAFIQLKTNYGQIYYGGTADYIMSYRDKKLYFQKLSPILRRLQTKYDFVLNMTDFLSYTFKREKFMSSLCLYNKDRQFIEMFYMCGSLKTYSTEDNISRIIKELESLGIKELTDAE